MCEDMTLHLILQYLKSTIHSKKKLDINVIFPDFRFTV